MYYVYVIQSTKSRQLYFGRSGDFEKRLHEHNSGANTSTKENRPWQVVYVEGYRAKKDAIARELKLKQYGNARTYVKNRIKESLLG